LSVSGDHEIDFPDPLNALQGDGSVHRLLIKVFAYLLALRLQAQGVFSKLTYHRDHAPN